MSKRGSHAIFTIHNWFPFTERSDSLNSECSVAFNTSVTPSVTIAAHLLPVTKHCTISTELIKFGFIYHERTNVLLLPPIKLATVSLQFFDLQVIFVVRQYWEKRWSFI